MPRGGKLECWVSGGKRAIYAKPPTPPYFYSKVRQHGKCESVERTLLSDLTRKVELFKVFAHDPREIRGMRDMNSLESRVRYVERLAIDYGFKQTDMDASLLAFDIEAYSKGQFPRPDRDTMAALAVCSASTQLCLVGEETNIIENFCKIVSEENPDILATYSGTAFDYEFPMGRAHRIGRRLMLGRRGDEPYIKTRTYEMGKRIGVDKTAYLKGRICFDVYNEVRFDTALSGIRRDLKSVSKYFFGDKLVKEVDRSRIGALSENELSDYCFSDARLTYLLANHYLSVLKQLAVMLNVPLDMMVHRSPSHIGNLLYGRRFGELGVVSDGANYERFSGVLW